MCAKRPNHSPGVGVSVSREVSEIREMLEIGETQLSESQAVLTQVPAPANVSSGVLELAGHVDRRTVALVREQLATLLATTEGDVTVDLTQVGLVDTSGLAALVVAHRRALSSGRRLILRGAGPSLVRALAITRLNRVLYLQRS